MCENDVFVLPVNILTGVARQLLGPHDTLPCVLITHMVKSSARTGVLIIRMCLHSQANLSPLSSCL